MTTAADRRPRAGRPTREQARQRHDELLDCALDVFLDNGFERSTMDAIAASTGMAKRTIYGLYPDKAALFTAAVQRAVDRWIVPIDDLYAVETDDLEETLIAIARMRLESFTSPAGVALQRILNAEGYRFPDLFRLAYEQGTRPALKFIADVLARHAATGSIDISDPELLGTAFLSMVVGGPATGVMWGYVLDADALDQRIRVFVRLFLDGVRPRT
ncbi:TetR/AcrR family transcriptional regulator [Mycolicibacterium moriokaense]|nr:TetR/AcrR family transcriptional regulator [Mycolicibacterium moriokaense]